MENFSAMQMSMVINEILSKLNNLKEDTEKAAKTLDSLTKLVSELSTKCGDDEDLWKRVQRIKKEKYEKHIASQEEIERNFYDDNT